MKLFVTGGSGFVGQRLLPRLKAGGHDIMALSRSEKSDALLRALDVSPVRGTLRDIETWSAHLPGLDIVIHAAAPIDVWGEWADMHRDITLATAQLAEAADREGVRRFIYLSSESVLQGDGPLIDIDEKHSYPKEPNSYYGKAKKLAEIALLEGMPDATRMERIILRPTFIWGAGCPQLENLTEKVRSGQFIWVDHGRASMEMVHVDNVVSAVELALTKGRGQQIYTVTDGAPMPVKTFLSAFIDTTGITIPERSLPSALLYPAAKLIEGLWRLLHIKTAPPLSAFQLDFVALPRRYNISKICDELGYSPGIDFERGIQGM